MRVRASRVRARLGGVPARARACTCAVVELRAVCTDILHSPARVPIVEVARGCYQTANMIPDRFWPSPRAHVRSAASFPDGRAADPGGRQTAAVGDQAATSIEGTSRRRPIGWPPRGPALRWPRVTPGRLAPRPRCRNTSRPGSVREMPNAEAPGCTPGRRTRLIDGPW